MNLFVLLRAGPDPVEELELSSDGRSLDSALLRYKLSDGDEHALEEALLLKERQPGTVTVLALDSPEIDDALYTALAKGADRVIKILGLPESAGSAAAAVLFHSALRALLPGGADDLLVLVRGQAPDDLDGEIGPFLAHRLSWPYLGVVTGVSAEEGRLVVVKEFAEGWRGEFDTSLPVVLGIQSAEKPPRYVPIAKVRAAMKTNTIEKMELSASESGAVSCLEMLAKPQPARRAEILTGSVEEVGERIVMLLANQSLI